jgi:hypothetical protein
MLVFKGDDMPPSSAPAEDAANDQLPSRLFKQQIKNPRVWVTDSNLRKSAVI